MITALNTIKALIKMKIPDYLPGYDYIVSAMSVYEKNGAPFTTMRLVYMWIADEHRTEPDFVMKSISDVIEYAFTKGDKAEAVKYFGLSQRSNGNNLAVLYQRLKEEE